MQEDLYHYVLMTTFATFVGKETSLYSDDLLHGYDSIQIAQLFCNEIIGRIIQIYSIIDENYIIHLK